MNNHIASPFVIIIASIYISISLLFGYLAVTPYFEALAQSPSNVHITKELANAYAISSGSSEIGTFDVNYTIAGDMDTIKKEQKLIVSTITDDFNNSPITGYVKMPGSHSQQQEQQQATMPNPFADNATINHKIETEINDAISPAGDGPATAKTSIQCNFGMSISEWDCKTLS